MTKKNETEKFLNEVSSIEEAEQRFREKESLIMKNAHAIKVKMKVEHANRLSNDK